MTKPDWIAVDWGTSNLRAWAMDAAGGVLDERYAAHGMGALTPESFEPTLLGLVDGWLADGRVTDVIACGMVGARQGWTEAPYAQTPCAPPGVDRAVLAPASDPRMRVHILPGVSQSRPADVMRGEETQVAGYLAEHPGFDGILCLPGTHTKWVHVSAGEIVSFRSYMTGELFALLSGQSVLRHGLTGEGWDDAAFLEALDHSLTQPEAVAGLFTLRAENLLSGLDPARARARLSGLLVGLELRAARPYWLGQPVVIIGEDRLARLYEISLLAQGADVGRAEADKLTLAGLMAAHDALEGDRT